MNVDKNNLNGFAISEECYKWIEENLPEGSTILELGSGNGTKELTKKWKVYSIENNPDWVGVAKDSNYIHAPLVKYPELPYEWYDIEVVGNNIPEKYDLILVDAPTGHGRWGFIHFIDLFNVDVPIIVDDTHREEERRVATKIGAITGKCVFDYSGHEKTFSVIE